jgi:hypothetical protein
MTFMRASNFLSSGRLETPFLRILGALALLLAFGPPRLSAQYAIDWFTIDGGGGTSTGGVYAVSGTIGQPDAGVLSGGGYSLAGGFWSILTALQTPGAPRLNITNAPGVAVVFWAQPAAGFLLEQTAALTSPPAAIAWSQVPPAQYQTNATHVYLTVPAPADSRVYRLRKP